jgi:hypothetical protein
VDHSVVVTTVTELDRLLARNRAANALKAGLDRGIDHNELERLIGAYLAADVGWHLANWKAKQP